MEFPYRQDRPARALVATPSNIVDAFVLEPGYTFQYYANVSQTDWEPWEPENGDRSESSDSRDRDVL